MLRRTEKNFGCRFILRSANTSGRVREPVRDVTNSMEFFCDAKEIFIYHCISDFKIGMLNVNYMLLTADAAIVRLPEDLHMKI